MPECDEEPPSDFGDEHHIFSRLIPNVVTTKDIPINENSIQ